MTDPDAPTAAQLAECDQAQAEADDLLRTMIHLLRGEPANRSVAIAALAADLADVPADKLAWVLACAIGRLAPRERP